MKNPSQTQGASLSGRVRKVAVFGLGALSVYILLAAFLIPHPWGGDRDCANYRHWVSTDFRYASSVVDLSVLSPFQGLAGLAQPIGVWLNPPYILRHFFGGSIAWSYLAVMILLGGATFLLGRASGLPKSLAVVGAQLISIFSFPPMWEWTVNLTHLNGVHLYEKLEGFAVPTALGTGVLAVFSYLGRLSNSKNLVCLVLLPVLIVYSVLIDPLYTAVFFVPVGFLLAGVFCGSESRKVLFWRAAGGAWSLAVCLGLNLHNFYRGLTGYAARKAFPNELYVEVQQWDFLTTLFFQRGFSTIGIVLLVACCLVTILYGGSQNRGLALSVLLYQWLMIAVSVIYVCSGMRWSQPLPVYLEVGAQPAYVVAALLGIIVLLKRFSGAMSSGKPSKLQALVRFLTRPSVIYTSVLILPILGSAGILLEFMKGSSLHQKDPDPQRAVGMVKFLQDEIGINLDGRFRGSVAMIVGVPGGGILKRFGVPESQPFTWSHIQFSEEYGVSFGPFFNTAGLWMSRVPTVHDNNHMVTLPFHFLVSRALSRPQDFHPRNFALITKPHPKLMAALGARFLVIDKPLSDPLLVPRVNQVNGDGVTIYAYEIQFANVGNLSPIRTVTSTNARETLALMSGEDFNLNNVAVVCEEPLAGLTRADSGAIYFEKGGVRVRAKSRGRSLLVLPIQFSNSLRILSAGGNVPAKPVRLLRANLLQTGVLFEGEIEIKLAHVFGPFRSVNGRLLDIEDCRRLGIKETGEIPYPPDYQPLGKRRFSGAR